jgi:uncharacterized membrane protein YjfL (UPF0719 family)
MIEILAPVPLGAIAIGIVTLPSEGFFEIVRAFPIFLLVAYGFGIVPSAVYAVIMEAWFYNQLNERYGLGLTICMSSLSGLILGLSICALSTRFTQAGILDYLRFAGIGLTVGLALGYFIVSRVTPKM